tara:strand:- start:4420 stop:4686 length:267 start_codon:yes stop_codon:yes gene_type:complete
LPKYTYRCEECEVVFCERHSATKRVKNCKECGSEDALVRLPSNFRVLKETTESPARAGSLVKQSIEDFKQDLASEKQKLKESVWEPNS